LVDNIYILSEYAETLEDDIKASIRNRYGSKDSNKVFIVSINSALTDAGDASFKKLD